MSAAKRQRVGDAPSNSAGAAQGEDEGEVEVGPRRRLPNFHSLEHVVEKLRTSKKVMVS